MFPGDAIIVFTPDSEFRSSLCLNISISHPRRYSQVLTIPLACTRLNVASTFSSPSLRLNCYHTTTSLSQLRGSTMLFALWSIISALIRCIVMPKPEHRPSVNSTSSTHGWASRKVSWRPSVLGPARIPISGKSIVPKALVDQQHSQLLPLVTSYRYLLLDSPRQSNTHPSCC